MTASPTVLPATMNCIEIPIPGAPEALVPGARPLPEPADGEVLVRVCAAGVNRPDVIQRQGNYAPPPGASDIPGLEIAGTVVALGAGVLKLAIGDRVCALVTGGGYAQYCTAPEAQCLPIPGELDDLSAAALPETFFTVWSNLYDRARLTADETLLIHGGSSGIGTTAIQIAKSLGSRVIVTAGSAEKCQACLDLGADLAINYRDEDYVDAVKKFTDGKGANVILDMVGGDYIAKNIAAAAVDGRIVSIAFLNGPKSEINFLPMMLKRLTLTGSTLRARPVADKAAIAAQLLDTVWPLIAAGKIRPVINTTFPLDQAAKAHALMESSAHIGKIMLTVE